MPIYKYKARDANGLIVSGTVVKQSKSEVVRYINDRYLTLIYTREAKFLLRPRVKMGDIVMFLRKLSLVLGSGITLSQAVMFLIKQNKNRRFNIILDEMHGDILKGVNLSDSVKKHDEFTDFMVSMIKIGEATGKIDSQLMKTADYYEKELRYKEEIKNALSYPAFIGALMVFLIFVVVAFVVPGYAGMFGMNDIALPLPTKILISLSDSFLRLYPFLMIFVFLAVLAVSYFKKTDKGRMFFDTLYLRIPFVKTLILKTVNFKLAESLSILISSGISIIESVDVVKNNVSNLAVKRHMGDMVLMLMEGKKFSECLDTCDYFDSLLKDLASVGEETGNLEKTMMKCAEYLSNEMETYIKRMSKFMEPAVIIVLGAILGFIMLSVIMPSLSLVETV